MNFYLRNKHLFEDDNFPQVVPSYPTRLDRLEQFLAQPKPVPAPNFPKFSSYEREEIPHPEPLKSVFSHNARNLLGPNYNDKFEKAYDNRDYAGRRNVENRSSYRGRNSQSHVDNVKSLIYSQDNNRNAGSIRDIDRYSNPLTTYDMNARPAGMSSVPKQRVQIYNPPEERNSYKELYREEIENPYGYGAIIAKNLLNNVPYEPYKRVEPQPPVALRAENRGGRFSHSISDPYGAYKQNLGLQQQQQQPQERPSIWQNDSHRTDRYNPAERNKTMPQPMTAVTGSRNTLNYDRNERKERSVSESSSKKNSPVKQGDLKERSRERMSHTENGVNILMTKEASTIKVTSRDPVAEERKDARFPLDDYQILKRKLGIKVDFSTSEKNSLKSTAQPQFLQNWQSRLDQLEMIRSRRTMTIPEALERRLLFAVNPERKERLKELLNEDTQ